MNNNTRFRARFPLSDQEFFDEYKGLPSKQPAAVNIFLAGLIVILIIVAIFIFLFYIQKPTQTIVDHTGFYNLDTLLSLDSPQYECCVFIGAGAPNEQYVYDTISNITYSREIPLNINTVCAGFGSPPACAAANTDANGNIIPIATFKAQPYYTFENGLFTGCASTTQCS